MANGTELVPFQTSVTIAGVTIGNLTSATPASREMDDVETTNHGNTDFWRRYRGTLVNGGEPELEVQLTAEQYAILMAMVDPSLGAQAVVMTFPFGTPVVVTFSALVKSVSPKAADIDSLFMATVKLKVSGPVAVT